MFLLIKRPLLDFHNNIDMISFFSGRYLTHWFADLKNEVNNYETICCKPTFVGDYFTFFYSQAIELYAVFYIRVKVFRFVVNIQGKFQEKTNLANHSCYLSKRSNDDFTIFK